MRLLASSLASTSLDQLKETVDEVVAIVRAAHRPGNGEPDEEEVVTAEAWPERRLRKLLADLVNERVAVDEVREILAAATDEARETWSLLSAAAQLRLELVQSPVST